MNTATQNASKQFKILSEEVNAFIKEHESLLNSSGLYKGVQILFSPVVYQPTFMLIGINPGAGYFKSNRERV